MQFCSVGHLKKINFMQASILWSDQNCHASLIKYKIVVSTKLEMYSLKCERLINQKTLNIELAQQTKKPIKWISKWQIFY